MSEFRRVCDVTELPAGGRLLTEVDERMIAVFRVGDAVYAIDDVCTHDGGPLAEGELSGYEIACPRHGAKFDIRTGAALTMPATQPTPSHEAKIENGAVWVRVCEGNRAV